MLQTRLQLLLDIIQSCSTRVAHSDSCTDAACMRRLGRRRRCRSWRSLCSRACTESAGRRREKQLRVTLCDCDQWTNRRLNPKAGNLQRAGT
jgi:hypothetical protein